MSNMKQFYTQNFKEQLESRQQPINTIQLQLDSLWLFMAHLSYVPVQGESSHIKGLRGFKFSGAGEGLYKKGLYPKFISFKDAVRLHNGVMSRKIEAPSGDEGFIDVLAFPYKFYIPLTIFKDACDSRLVEQVYLQKLNKHPYVKVQQHWVKLLEDKA